MSNVYFIKELVNSPIFYSGGDKFPHKKDGEAAPFTHGGDDYGHLVLDSEKDAHEIAELRFLYKNRRGGIVEVDEARYESEKKRPPSTKMWASKSGMPRLAEQKLDPFRSRSQVQSALPAGGLANAVGVGGNPAAPAPVPASVLSSSDQAPPANGFTPRKGKAGKGK